jgi:hypothetical protein
MTPSKGEEKAWEILETLNPSEVCQNGGVSFDSKTGLYILESLGKAFTAFPKDKKIVGLTEDGQSFLDKLGYFLTLSVPWYLTTAKAIPLSNKLVRPEDVSGGDIFFKGSHVLPLEQAAKKYGQNKTGFIEKSRRLGGVEKQLGDCAFELRPMPRIVVVLILWLADDEFPARMDFLFDSTAEYQAPLDIVWSLAMMTSLAYLI